MSFPRLARAIIETLQISVPTVLESARGSLTPERCDRRLDWWSRRLLEQADVRLAVTGLDRVPADEAFVVMSNHQSLYDIPVIFQALKRRVRMVAKKELFHIPVWAQAMRSAGFVEIDRTRSDRAIESLKAAEEILRQGTSIWIAPEGTRSRNGQLGRFKKGGFHLALATQTRILPVSIDGTREVLTARGWSVKRGATVRVAASDPVDPSRYGPENLDELVQVVRASVAAHLPSLLD
jgi:1-acyl-sn-glycerol-3-phosphate acyltransferase